MNYPDEYRRIAVALAVVCALLLLVWLTGCGGRVPVSSTLKLPGHHAVFSDPRFQSAWTDAQRAISREPIFLNAAYVAEKREYVNDMKPADIRANDIWPDGVTVSAEPDLTVAQLQAENPGETLKHFADPTGVIHAPDGSSAKYCAAYTLGNSIVVANSLLYDAGILEYEFENVILRRLGYDTRKR
jgi:hypothetical protein